MARVIKEYNTISEDYCSNEEENNKCWFLGDSSYYCREFSKHLRTVEVADDEFRKVRPPECKRKYKEGIVVKVLG